MRYNELVNKRSVEQMKDKGNVIKNQIEEHGSMESRVIDRLLRTMLRRALPLADLGRAAL